MPKNTREWAQRKFDMAEGNCNWVITHLAEIAEIYADEHPEIAAPCIDIISAIQIMQRGIVKLRMSL